MLSQTSEYALRAMSCLAYAPDELTPTPVLARYTKVPSNYLAKVLQLLAQADLIVGRRGVGGGYRLAKAAADITMLDVVNAIDPVRRIESCPLGLPNHGGVLCALHKALDEAAMHILNTFSGVTMADLVADAGGSRPLCDTELAEQLAAVSVDGVSLKATAAASRIGALANGNGHGSEIGNGTS
ncbi:MAG: Rrf2 family transcriptional regulator [Planctomycetota bacterium]